MVAWYFPIKSVIKFKILWVKFLQTFFDFHLQSNFVIFGMGVIFPCRSNVFRTYYMARAYSFLFLFHFISFYAIISPHAVEDPMHPVWSLNYYLTPIIDSSHREGCNYWNLCRIASASCYQPWNTGWQTSTSPESIAFGLDRLF